MLARAVLFGYHSGMETMTPVTLRVRELREAKGMSQGELSRRSGVRQATLSAIENDQAKTVSLELLARLARALGVDAALLIVDDHEGK